MFTNEMFMNITLMFMNILEMFMNISTTVTERFFYIDVHELTVMFTNSAP